MITSDYIREKVDNILVPVVRLFLQNQFNIQTLIDNAVAVETRRAEAAEAALVALIPPPVDVDAIIGYSNGYGI